MLDVVSAEEPREWATPLWWSEGCREESAFASDKVSRGLASLSWATAVLALLDLGGVTIWP